MAEPLKNSYGPDIPVRIADMVERVFPAFDRELFLQSALDGYEELELTPRARHISKALAQVLPSDRDRAIRIIVDSLGPEIGWNELAGMESFLFLPFVFFVADHGLDCFETSMRAQYELTKRFTAEFSIRAFIERYPEETLSASPSGRVTRTGMFVPQETATAIFRGSEGILQGLRFTEGGQWERRSDRTSRTRCCYCRRIFGSGFRKGTWRTM